MDFLGEAPMPSLNERVDTMLKAVEGLTLYLSDEELYILARKVAKDTPNYSMLGYYQSGAPKKEIEKFLSHIPVTSTNRTG
jgi:hypothetical protein